MIKEIVLEIRRRQPKVGVRKLQRHLNQRLLSKEIKVGRDRLFGLLRSWKLLIRPKRNFKRTTNSRHWFKIYKNLIKDKPPARPDEIWVADITYIKIRGKFCYLFLIMDLFSRRVVGYNVSHSLAIEGAFQALRMALKQRTGTQALIHHSDRGLQYCCDDYIHLLKEHGVEISLTEEDHVYENAFAERLNGILKSEFLLHREFPTIHEVKRMVADSVEIYNKERLHTNLNYRTPHAVHYALASGKAKPCLN